MDVVTEGKRPLEQALDIVVYAPIGFALEARRLLPTFVDRGRAQVQMTRMVGKFAVKQGQQVAEKRLSRVQAQAEDLIGADQGGSEPPRSAAPASPAPATRRAATAQSGEEAVTLAIPDYDSLAASQVIPRLDGLSESELADVARYEQLHRARKTILGKITQLQDR